MSAMKITKDSQKGKKNEKFEKTEEEEIDFDTKVDELGKEQAESEKESKTDDEILKDDTIDDMSLEEIVREGI
jgi:hypothetical protein